jgi:hypothetical protein
MTGDKDDFLSIKGLDYIELYEACSMKGNVKRKIFS